MAKEKKMKRFLILVFRTITTIFMLVILLLASLPVYIHENFLKKNSSSFNFSFPGAKASFWSKNLIAASGSTIQVLNSELIPRDASVLFVSNHRSFLDIPVFLASIQKPVGFVAKMELKKVPLLSKWIQSIGCVLINREDIRQSLKAIIECTNHLKKGHSMVIFPEGTRNAENTLMPFKSGSLKPAIKAHVPLVPVAIYDTRNIFENNKFYVCPSKITIIVGEPIVYDELPEESKKDIGSLLSKTISKMLDDPAVETYTYV